jgi:hypothetical protein
MTPRYVFTVRWRATAASHDVLVATSGIADDAVLSGWPRCGSRRSGLFRQLVSQPTAASAFSIRAISALAPTRILRSAAR